MKLPGNRVLAFAATTALSLSGSAALFAGTASTDVAAEVKMMDTNGDGKISADEHAAGASKMFKNMDADKDSTVTAAEMDKASAAKGKSGQQISSAEKIRTIDTNGDGKLSADEHAAGSHAMFEKMDTDHDSLVTADELQAGHDAMLTKRK